MLGAMLNFARPEVREWAHETVDRLVRTTTWSGMKIDTTSTSAIIFDPAATGQRRGTVLADHIAGYYAWLDEVRARHPKLVIENCSSGGLRFDLGILAHTHTNWLSDNVARFPARNSPGAAPWNSCRRCAITGWSGEGEGDGASVDNNAPPGWWDFMFECDEWPVWHSSRVFDWSPSLRQRARRTSLCTSESGR